MFSHLLVSKFLQWKHPPACCWSYSKLRNTLPSHRSMQPVRPPSNFRPGSLPFLLQFLSQFLSNVPFCGFLMFPQEVCPRVCALRGSYGKCKGRCLIRVLTLVRGFLPGNFCIKWRLSNLDMRFDCPGSHKVCGAVLGRGIFPVIFRLKWLLWNLDCVLTAQARTTCMSSFWAVRLLSSFWDARSLAQSVSLRSTSGLLLSRRLFAWCQSHLYTPYAISACIVFGALVSRMNQLTE